MHRLNIKLFLKSTILLLLFNSASFSDNHNIKEIIELIQKDIKTLERAVYSDSSESKNNNIELSNSDNLDQKSEDVLTRHLLKLSEIENQFRDLTNKFEEINFKLDKLSNNFSKVQQDNQLRFEQIEQNSVVNTNNKSLTSLPKTEQTSTNEKITPKKILPGSSEPQSLG